MCLGEFYRLQGKCHKAEKCHVQALEIHTKLVECFTQVRVAYASIADDHGESKALDRLMRVYLMQDKLAETKETWERAREIYTRMGRPMSETYTQIWELVSLLDQDPE
ncbi:hypothetical protein FRC00_002316, partial [Tulasnella sp. 408]